MPGAQPFPWEEVLQLLMGRLHWSPHSVWSATPREVALALEGLAGRSRRAAPMERTRLDALCALFPDEVMNHAR